jgi:hypothetical protein
MGLVARRYYYKVRWDRHTLKYLVKLDSTMEPVFVVLTSKNLKIHMTNSWTNIMHAVFDEYAIIGKPPEL